MPKIFTSAQLKQLRRDATRLERLLGITHYQALDSVARQHGHDSWALLMKHSHPSTSLVTEMTTPTNHHFVPMHFLKAWARNGSEDRLFRFRSIPHNGRFECKEVSIRYSASEENLYEIRLQDGTFEIESSIVTPELDELGHKILNRIRSSPFSRLTDEEKRELAVYLTCLEARHPEILEEMDVREHIEPLRESMKATSGFSHGSIDEVLDYFKASKSLGVMAFSWFVQNERSGTLGERFSDGLVRAKVVEYEFDHDCLITSDFPCFRMGDYLGHFLYVVALSPRKALIYSPSEDIKAFEALPASVRADTINLYVVGRASRAFWKSKQISADVERHLGWARKCKSTKDKQAYVAKVLRAKLLEHGIA